MNQININLGGPLACLNRGLLPLLFLLLQTPLWSQDPCAGVNINVGCIANVNVTLNADCEANITPSMVMTGNFNCADEIQITVDGGNSSVISGCGEHTYSVVVIENGATVYTCWGNIFAEDKTNPVVVCPDNTSTADVNYSRQVITSSLDATDPTLNLANYSCFTDAFTPLPGQHNYQLISFTPSASDVYTFLTASAWGDAHVALFQGGFNPSDPCQNIIGQSEDTYLGDASIFDTDIFFGPAIFDPAYRLALPLVAGQTYTLFVSNFSPAGLGAFAIAVYSDGDGFLQGNGIAAPQDVLLEGLDLICDDIDGIRFGTPQSWITNADGELDFNATRNTFFGGSTAALNAFLAKLQMTGIPVTTDNCGPVLVTLSDVVQAAGDCGTVVLRRTFTVQDRYNSACIGTPRTATCTQNISFRKLTVADVVLPPFTAPLECDENFPTDGNIGGPDNNPHASVTGYPWVITALGFHNLDDDYCNIGANYSDEPRINICEGSYSFRREWNIIDWCDPSNSFEWDQFVKVGDYTGPVISGVAPVISISTSPFTCLGNAAIPTPTVTDGNGCSSARPSRWSVLAFGEAYFAGGPYVLTNGAYLPVFQGSSAPYSRAVVGAPIGEHLLIICSQDACGNETCEEYTLVVADLIEPSAACDDELNVSIGGGDIANNISGIARIFAADIDEGSFDNCGPVTLEVRRNFWRNNTCDPSANRWSPWGNYVDFYCCDIANEIVVELRVTDQAGNSNVCWMTVTPEDKLNPYCYAPANVALTCAELPLAFPGDLEAAYDNDFAATSLMMNAIFGGATGTDNCQVDTIVERTPNIQINECGWGSITRRFEVWQLRPEGDVNGNGAIDINEVFRSTNNCSQLITITEVHDFVIDFPEDTEADCGDPEIPTILTETDGCDVLSINIGTPVRFSATGDECYKMSITYDVINWCLWDGEYTGYNIARMTEDDGESLPIDRAVEGNERPVVRYDDTNGLCIDRRHNDRDGDSSLPNCQSPQLSNYGRYRYTQFIKVYDSTAPVVSVGAFGGPTANCPDLAPGQFGDDDGDCQEPVSIPFSVSDDCELFDGNGNLVVSIISAELDAFAVDANRDGSIKSNEFVADMNVLSNITNNGDGTFTFSGTFPIITSDMGDNIYHAVRILFEDGCGNRVSEYIEFTVVDCKGPAPICINGLTVTLMPQEGGGCAMAIWASDFEASPISDCTGQGPGLVQGLPRVTKFAVYRASTVESNPNFVPSPNDTGLVLTDEDEETTIVYVYAFDEEGNYDYCETYVLVQQHTACNPAGTGTIQGVIATDDAETIEGVQVNVNGGTAQMTTTANGTFQFDLQQGGDYSITPYLNANPLNGVSTFDLVLMSKHILGVQPLANPYRIIAADVNNSRTVTTLDMIQLRKLILNIDTQFSNNTSWRFIPAGFIFPVPQNPWFNVFPELTNVNNLAGQVNADFVGVKIGDVNGSAQANALAGDDRNLNGTYNLAVANESLRTGNVYTVAFRGSDLEQISGFQGTLRLNGAELVDIEYGLTTAENFGLRFADQGMITMSWNASSASVKAADVLFSLVIRATDNVTLSEAISINSRYTAAEAYNDDQVMNLGISFTNATVAAAGFELFQNSPNPFRSETVIGFNLAEDAEVSLTISDVNGRLVTSLKGAYAAGYNTINLNKEMLKGVSGVLTYTLSTTPAANSAADAKGYTATKKMIVVE